ncbi:MAG: hypothetical protein KAT43_02180 [Nanoarchaeota archaeon]|nr:hypothetical protein [Nanoarchaeota archaeon]
MTSEKPKSDFEILEERATIDLPRLSLEELEKLFKHLAEHLPATVSYSIHEDNKCIYGHSREEGEKIKTRPGVFRVSGMIHARTSASPFGCKFDSERETYNFVAIALRFDTVAFNRIEEFREDEVQLWDNVRQLANDYFV